MFLAHFSSTPIGWWEQQPANEVREWHEDAVSLHNYLNQPPEEPTS